MAIGNVQNQFDIQEYVSQIMQYERRPLTALQDRKTNTENQITSWDSINATFKKLQSALDELQKSSTFLTNKATSSDSSIVTATGGVNSAETTYTFSDITLAAAASKTSTSALGFSSGTAASIISATEIITGASSVNPNQALSTLNLNLDPGKAVVSGSFYVNGKKITVESTDTIYTILSKINSSGANIEATFADDTITIQQKTAGVSYSVRLSDDTTGFFDAMKLDDASDYPSAYGVNPDWQRTLADSAIGGTVTDGYFNINNITFSVDVDSESLSNIINKINSSEAGVLAFYDSAADKVTLTSTVDGQDITLKNDTAGLFATGALNITDLAEETFTGTSSTFTINGTVMTRSSNTFELNGTTFTLRGSLASGETATITVEKDTDKTETALREFVDKYNDTISEINAKVAADQPLENNRKLKAIHRALRSMVAGSISHEGNGNLKHLSEVGISINHEGRNSTLSFDRAKLVEAMNNDVNDVFKLFAINTENYVWDDDVGFSVDFEEYLKDFTRRYKKGDDPRGYIPTHNDFLRDSIDRLDRRIERMEERMDQREQSLIEEFTELQNAVAKLENMSFSLVSFMNQFS